MKRFIKKLLGIEALEKRIERIENLQTSANLDKSSKKFSDNVLDEWVNGEEKDI